MVQAQPVTHNRPGERRLASILEQFDRQIGGLEGRGAYFVLRQILVRQVIAEDGPQPFDRRFEVGHHQADMVDPGTAHRAVLLSAAVSERSISPSAETATP